jgi:hypothetical protein
LYTFSAPPPALFLLRHITDRNHFAPGVKLWSLAGECLGQFVLTASAGIPSQITSPVDSLVSPQRETSGYAPPAQDVGIGGAALSSIGGAALSPQRKHKGPPYSNRWTKYDVMRASEEAIFVSASSAFQVAITQQAQGC